MEIIALIIIFTSNYFVFIYNSFFGDFCPKNLHFSDSQVWSFHLKIDSINKYWIYIVTPCNNNKAKYKKIFLGFINQEIIVLMEKNQA